MRGRGKIKELMSVLGDTAANRYWTDFTYTWTEGGIFTYTVGTIVVEFTRYRL